ncbi:MAG: hypothetical protein ACJASC_002231 [Limimaricola cinnabarinus]|jgi:hypothetical protein|uniref:DUF2948 domain-containing protein n=1 Tax=Limimaricola cinnabarinus LL-001 TaxID=1337093 RepID=U2YZF3_9RHOB|nr:DUF2948 family protein [Limimaricola cinnabarinus]GAD54465.1 hypothetical protein MBELCI_0517 [Limimaricola cinnabarinus LL-001]
MTATRDATFEEGAQRPLRLKALDGDDVQVISALVQDSVLPAAEMAWRKSERRFGMLLNRFRWEDPATTREAERVQSVLCVENVMAVRSQGLDPRDRDTVLSLLAVVFAPGEDGTGTIRLILAGDGEIAIDVEAPELVLRDVTRPYAAPSGKAPRHPE